MQPPETSELTACAAPAVLVVHELRRRRDLAVGPDRPVAVVEVERRHDVGQVDVRLPVGVDRADVAPVGLAPRRRSARRIAVKRCATALPCFDQVRDDVLAEIVARVRVGGVAAQLLEQELGRRTRRCPCWPAPCRACPGMPGGSFGFSRNDDDAVVRVDCITPKPVASMRGTSMQPTVTSAPLARAAAASARSPSCRCGRRPGRRCIPGRSSR